MLSCTTTERCVPDNPPAADFASRACPWIKLPDSLCPEAGHESMFGCHLGALTNVNNEAGYPSSVACTMDAPSSTLPDEQGQCCDPLGAGTDGLPACNAFRVINDFAASAAEITDAPSNDLQPVCTL
jgi:hypothetical protein